MIATPGGGIRARSIPASNVAGASSAVPLFSIRPQWGGGYVELESRDAWTTFRLSELVDGVECTRTIRLGPAYSRASLPVVEGGAVDVIACTVAAGITFSPLGVQSTATAAPTWSARWFPRDMPPEVTPRSIVVGGDTADVAAVAAASSVIVGAAPAYARRAVITAALAGAYVQMLDRAGAVVGVVQISGQTPIDVSPEWRLRLYNTDAAVTLAASIAWTGGV